MKKKVVKNKIIGFIVLSLIVFGFFHLFAFLIPSFLNFSSRSAIAAVKFSLPESADLISKLSFDSFDDHFNNSDFDGFAEFDGNESSLFKSKEAVDFIDFEPPFLIGPSRTVFSKNEIKNYFENDGPIYRSCYRVNEKMGDNIVKLSKLAYAKNLTKLPNKVIEQANLKRPSFVIDEGQQPQVLILHTHATEAYEAREKNFYSNKAPNNSRNSKINVVGVGEEIVNQLKLAGIGVVHDKKIHDDPSYNGAYDRSNQTIRAYLEKYPSIKVVLDVHRDGIQNKNNERIAPITKIDGRKAAQILIIAGCDNGNMHYLTYEKNLAFACFLQRNLEADYPKLTRPLLFKYKHYNQSLTPGTLLVEIGSNSNSVDEARFSGWLFGKSLAKALLKLKK